MEIFCQVCKTNVTKDEFHFISKCSMYYDLRRKCINPIRQDKQNVNEWEQFKLIIISIILYILNNFLNSYMKVCQNEML